MFLTFLLLTPGDPYYRGYKKYNNNNGGSLSGLAAKSWINTINKM